MHPRTDSTGVLRQRQDCRPELCALRLMNITTDRLETNARTHDTLLCRRTRRPRAPEHAPAHQIPVPTWSSTPAVGSSRPRSFEGSRRPRPNAGPPCLLEGELSPLGLLEVAKEPSVIRASLLPDRPAQSHRPHAVRLRSQAICAGAGKQEEGDSRREEQQRTAAAEERRRFIT